MKIYPQTLLNLSVTDKNAALNDTAVQGAVKAVEKKLGTGGRVLLRASGTEPLLRLMVETHSKELCKTCADVIVSVLRDRKYIN